MKKNAFPIVAALVFGLIAVGHAIRAVNQTPVLIGSSPLPVAVSWILVLAAGALSIWGFRSAR